MFPMVPAYISVVDLASAMSELSEPVAYSEYQCVECDYSLDTRSEITCFAELQCSSLHLQSYDMVAQILGRLLSMTSQRVCPECSGKLIKNTYMNEAPQLLILHIPYTNIKISQKMNIGGKTLCLKGVVYYGNYHYTSRIIDSDKNIWFHDGMTTGSGSQSQGSVTKIKSKYFNKYNRKSVALLVYAQR